MEKLVTPFRIAFCIGLAGMVIPLCIYGNFVGDFLPAWPHMPLVPLWVDLFSLVVLIACAGVLFSSRPRMAATLLGFFLLAVYLFGYVTYDLFVNPENNHFIDWAGELTESALAGGAFIVAGTFPAEHGVDKSRFLRALEKLIPLGPFLFCATMILYGLMHFMYPQLVSQLVPAWIPQPVFWTYLAGAALMLSGLAILFKIQLKNAAFLLGCMIFIWFLVLHIPRGINDLLHHRVFEFSRSFGALAFSSTAFVIAGMAAAAKRARQAISPALQGGRQA